MGGPVKEILPQAGTAAAGSGESRTPPASVGRVCPTYSGGGNLAIHVSAPPDASGTLGYKGGNSKDNGEGTGTSLRIVLNRLTDIDVEAERAATCALPMSQGHDVAASAKAQAALEKEFARELDMGRFLRPKPPRGPPIRFRRLSEEGESDSSTMSVNSQTSTVSTPVTRLAASRAKKRAKPLSPPKGSPAQKRRVVTSSAASSEDEAALEERERQAEVSRAILGLETDSDSRPAGALLKQMLEDVRLIGEVATKSKNLKGSFVAILNRAAQSISSAVEKLQNRPSSEETAKLEAENLRLQREMDQMKKEMAELRAAFERSRTSAPAAATVAPRPPSPMTTEPPQFVQAAQDGELRRAIMLEVGGLLNARMEAIEGRLLPEERLRPPLAADRRRDAEEEELRLMAEPSKAITKQSTAIKRSLQTARPSQPAPKQPASKPVAGPSKPLARQDVPDSAQRQPEEASETDPPSKKKKKKGKNK